MARCSQVEFEMQAYLDGELSRAKELIVEEHIATCNQCKEKFESLRKSNAVLYETLSPYKLNESLDEYIMQKLPKFDTNVNQIHQIPIHLKHQEDSPYSLSNLFPYFAIAAMTILGVFIFLNWPEKEISEQKRIGIAYNITGTSFIFNNNTNDKLRKNTPTILLPNNYIETRDDSVVYISLTANTILKLSNNTRVYIVDERTVNLEKGKAWFDIGKHKKMFRVNTPQGLIKVFGTQFQVEVNYDQIITTVVRGEVTVETENQFVVLKENQQVNLKNKKIETDIQTCNSRLITAWAENVIPNNQILEKITEEVGAPTQPIEITKPASQVFVVPIQHKDISSLVLVWDKSKTVENTNYTIYASDDELKPLFKYKLSNEIIQTYNGEINIFIPPDVVMKNVNMLHIEIISDDIDNATLMPFRKVYARN